MVMSLQKPGPTPRYLYIAAAHPVYGLRLARCRSMLGLRFVPIHSQQEYLMYKRILLAYDGSPSGQQALLDCQDLAQWAHSELTLVAVMPMYVDLMGMGGGGFDGQILEREKQALQRVLDEGTRRLVAAGHNASGQVLEGDVVDEITKYATKISADLIVVGHKHLDSWAARWWRGSISKALIEHSPCSVLVAITR